MKLRYSRKGGIAGIATHVELDSAKLPAAKAETLGKLLSPPASAKKKKALPDDIIHELQVQVGAKKYQFSCRDADCSPDLLDLFDYLHRKALSALKRTQRR